MEGWCQLHFFPFTLSTTDVHVMALLCLFQVLLLRLSAHSFTFVLIDLCDLCFKTSHL